LAKCKTQARKSDTSTRKVLNAALALFSRQGYRATSMRQLATRSGLSVGNLYHHFGTKETIFQCLIDDYWKVPLAAALPNGRFVAVPKAGHLVGLEQPEAVNAAIVEFLDARRDG
jgi:AcrR family transcriptional regulator